MASVALFTGLPCSSSVVILLVVCAGYQTLRVTTRSQSAIDHRMRTECYLAGKTSFLWASNGSVHPVCVLRNMPVSSQFVEVVHQV